MKLKIDLALELLNLELGYWDGKLRRYEFSLFTFWGTTNASGLFKIHKAGGTKIFDIFYFHALKTWIRGWRPS